MDGLGAPAWRAAAARRAGCRAREAEFCLPALAGSPEEHSLGGCSSLQVRYAALLAAVSARLLPAVSAARLEEEASATLPVR